jgi:hypothetical protein
MHMATRINPELDQALNDHHGFVEAEGSGGKVIVMSAQVYREMMGVGSNEEMAASLNAIKQAMSDLDGGRGISLDEARRRFDQKYGVSN